MCRSVSGLLNEQDHGNDAKTKQEHLLQQTVNEFSSVLYIERPDKLNAVLALADMVSAGPIGRAV